MQNSRYSESPAYATPVRTRFEGESSRVAMPVRLTGLFVLLYFLSLTLLGNSPGTAMIVDWILIALVCVFVAEQIGMRRNLSFPAPLVCFALFLCYLLLQMTWSPGSVSRLLTLASLFVMALVVVNYEAQVRGPSALECAFYAAVVCTFVYNFFSNETPVGGRVGSTLGNPNSYAELLMFAILFGARRWLVGSAGQRLTRKSLLALAALLVVGLYGIVFLSGSRKGMIFVLAGCVLILGYWVWLQPVRRRMLVSVLVVLILAGVGYVLYQSPKVERVSEITAFLRGESVQDTGLVKRGEMLDDAVDLWLQRPLTGWGLDRFREVSGWATYSHNNYVELLANEGLLGTLAYLLVYTTLLISLLRSLRRSKDAVLSAELYWALVVLLIMIGWSAAAVTYYSHIMWLVLSAVIAVSVRARARLQPSDPDSSSRSDPGLVPVVSRHAPVPADGVPSASSPPTLESRSDD
ncbi:MAG: O-antigen ligase family protein [Armatimonadetes bacterium]|nr:O-antigen ligase family protein [Armatimonadota bacterium]